MLASYNEVVRFQKSNLGPLHFRYYSPMSHAWCTPSAKHAVITVLLAGEASAQRGLVAFLPPEIWACILEMIPRHELRVGACAEADEFGALTDYNLILACKPSSYEALAVQEFARSPKEQQQITHTAEGTTC